LIRGRCASGSNFRQPRALLTIHELIDSSEKYLRRKITTLFATQRALDHNRLERKFTDTGRNVPAALLAGDNEHLPC
jgi:hypothetical protein